MLRYRAPNRYHVTTHARRYIPRRDDLVLGIVEERIGEQFKININSCTVAMIHRLAFEGATKRNCPNLRQGALLYCRVALANKDIDTELTCAAGANAPESAKRDWHNSHAVFGELHGGTAFRCSLNLAQSLLRPDCTVLNALARHMPFEVAVGANGIVWANADRPARTALVCNAIRNSEILPTHGTEVMVQQLIQAADNTAMQM
jgi:exosome complex component RRP40